jgi:aarF domain-containing kinase
VCATNGGLYIKLGQAVTTMAHVLPPEFMTYFSVLHDQAPQASHSEVQICSSIPHLGGLPVR